MDHLKDPILSSVILMVLEPGAIGPLEATPLWVNVDWPDFGSDIFNLVIHLSKVQQTAFLFTSLLAMSRGSRCPFVNPRNLHLFALSAVSSNHKLPFCCSSSIWSATWHERQKATGMSLSCRCGHFGFWWGWTYCASNSRELEQLFMPMWLDLTTVPFWE